MSMKIDTTKMPKLEKYIESYLKKRCKDAGFLCEKFISPSNRSVPDRLITAKNGRIVFCEVKAAGKYPTLAQQHDHQKRRELGCEVYVVDSFDAVAYLIKELEK